MSGTALGPGTCPHPAGTWRVHTHSHTSAHTHTPRVHAWAHAHTRTCHMHLHVCVHTCTQTLGSGVLFVTKGALLLGTFCRQREEQYACMHTWHVLTHALTTCFHMCVHIHVRVPKCTHTHRCRLHISRPCSHPSRSAPSPEGSPRLLPHPCPCLPCENLAQGKASIPSPAHSWDGPWCSLLL